MFNIMYIYMKSVYAHVCKCHACCRFLKLVRVIVRSAPSLCSSSSGLSCHTPQLLIKCLYSPHFSHQGLYIVTVNVSQGHLSPTMTGLWPHLSSIQALIRALSPGSSPWHSKGGWWEEKQPALLTLLPDSQRHFILLCDAFCFTQWMKCLSL